MIQSKRSVMKVAIAVFLSVFVLPASQVYAWVGGPFGTGNTYTSGGDDGIYEAIATTEDGLGMYRWAVQNSSTVGAGNQLTFSGGFGTSNVTFGGLAVAQNPHVWFYRGVTYYGQCIGTVNSSLNRITCIGNASDSGLDGGDVAINGVNLAGGTSGEGTAANNNGQAFGGDIGVLGVGSADRKSFCNSNFQGTFDKGELPEYTYVRRFKAKGTVTFYAAPDQRYFLIDTDGFNPDGDFAQVDVEFGGNNDIFIKQGHTRVINVIGSRVSFTPTGTVSSGL